MQPDWSNSQILHNDLIRLTSASDDAPQDWKSFYESASLGHSGPLEISFPRLLFDGDVIFQNVCHATIWAFTVNIRSGIDLTKYGHRCSKWCGTYLFSIKQFNWSIRYIYIARRGCTLFNNILILANQTRPIILAYRASSQSTKYKWEKLFEILFRLGKHLYCSNNFYLLITNFITSGLLFAAEKQTQLSRILRRFGPSLSLNSKW